jgi:methylmalonyl-CoA epimerase
VIPERPAGGSVGDIGREVPRNERNQPQSRPRVQARATGGTLARAVFGRIDHIGVAVTDLDQALDLYENAYGLALVHRETVSEQGVEAVLLDVGENHVELLRPLHEDTPVGKFLAKRGPGLHHVAYQVADIEATLLTLRDRGLRLIDQTPRIGIRNSRVAFLHPASSGGVLTEIVQPAEGH